MTIISVVNSILLALSAEKRFGALQEVGNSKTSTSLCIALTCLIVIGMFKLFLCVKGWVDEHKRDTNKRMFFDIAEEKKLGRRETKMLMSIVSVIDLKQQESIFTLASAFDRGAAKLVEEYLVLKGVEAGNCLRTELAFLRQKLDFGKQHPASIRAIMKSDKLSSRQIPAGEKIQIKNKEIKNSETIDVVILENENKRFVVKSEKPIKSRPGDLWYGCYYFGASIWEFESLAVDSGGDTLSLEHSDSIRFINRRRFPRIPVKKPAFVGRVPLGRTITADTDSTDESAHDSNWGCQQLVQTVITELAGPGLRIDVPFELMVGDRLMVVFEIDEKGTVQSTYQTTDSDEAKTIIIEDVGIVRNARAIENGWSVAVELIGLSNSDVNTLIHATNAASLKPEPLENNEVSRKLLARIQAENKVAEDTAAGKPRQWADR